MKTTTQQQLWIHDSGAISCEEHFGNYARSELGRTPRARLSQTLALALAWLAIFPKKEW